MPIVLAFEPARIVSGCLYKIAQSYCKISPPVDYHKPGNTPRISSNAKSTANVRPRAIALQKLWSIGSAMQGLSRTGSRWWAASPPAARASGAWPRSSYHSLYVGGFGGTSNQSHLVSNRVSAENFRKLKIAGQRLGPKTAQRALDVSRNTPSETRRL
jgi:hypothetical protein